MIFRVQGSEIRLSLVATLRNLHIGAGRRKRRLQQPKPLSMIMIARTRH